MCAICGTPTTIIDYIINDGLRDPDVTICPNCSRLGKVENNPIFHEGIYKSEISGSLGAVKIFSDGRIKEDKPFIVTLEEADRLFRADLRSEEYKKLIENGHTTDEYLINLEFYNIDGKAKQANKR